MPTLYELSDDLHRLQVALDEMELTPEDQAAALDAFLGGADDLKHKLDGYACLLREYETTAAGRKAEADRLAALAKSDSARAKALKDRLCWFFETHELDKVKTERFAFTLANNGGAQAMDVDTEHLPANLLTEQLTMTYEQSCWLNEYLTNAGIGDWWKDVQATAKQGFDGEKVREALAAGLDVPGARLLPRGRHMLIR